MNWEEQKTVKKGTIGEQIVFDFLTEKGFIVYVPVTNGAHKIDFFAHKSGASKNVIAAEVKSKRRMAKFPSTGFNYSSYEHYQEILDKHSIDTFCFFVDDFEGCIYGSWLSKLGEGRIIGGGRNKVIVWGLDSMKLIRHLTFDEVNQLTEHTTEKYSYENVERYFN